ncbi:MAG: AAA family ATPase [Myxococcota bacterium]
MTVEDGFSELNAAFLDRVLRRWEARIEHHVRLKHGAFETEEDAAKAEEQVRATLGAIGEEIAELRAWAGEKGWRFPLDQVVGTHRLDAIEASILELALAPLLDLSFRQRIARYNNNILLDFVDVDLALSLLLPRRQDRLRARAYFAEDAPLLVHRLLTLESPREPKGSGMLARELRPPERMADFVLGRRSLDVALRPHARLVMPRASLEQVVLPPGEKESLLRLAKAFAAEGPGQAPPFPVGRGLVVEVAGPPGTGKTLLAEALAHHLGRPLVHVDSASLHGATDFPRLVDALVSEARVQGAVLLLDRCEPLLAKGSSRLPALFGQLGRFGGLAVLTNSRPEELDPGVERHVAWKLDLGMPEADERQALWEVHAPEGVTVGDDVDLQDLASRFELTGGQIHNAWEVAFRRAEARAADGDDPHIDQGALREAAQAQIRANMDDYSIRSKVDLTLDDLVLPDREKGQVREVLDACRNRVFVMSKWGFGKRLVTGKGLCILFKGEPGTGKTLCAEIMASELGMKLYQVSIPKIVSKYIGETEKNISKIFSSARANHSMLLFDEADSLFTKRVAVENAVDRFSNMEVNLLLQEIERFEGVTILTTNLDKNIDDAFARRIQYKIDFPFPNPEHRALIWRTLFPKEAPVDGEIDFEDLGEAFELSGGHIKNSVVRAAYRAAGRDSAITWEDIEFAAEQECKNAGKLFRTSKAHDDW